MISDTDGHEIEVAARIYEEMFRPYARRAGWVQGLDIDPPYHELPQETKALYRQFARWHLVACEAARAEERAGCAALAKRFGHENYPTAVWPDTQDGSLDRAGALMARRTGENIAAAILLRRLEGNIQDAMNMKQLRQYRKLLTAVFGGAGGR